MARAVSIVERNAGQGWNQIHPLQPFCDGRSDPPLQYGGHTRYCFSVVSYDLMGMPRLCGILAVHDPQRWSKLTRPSSDCSVIVEGHMGSKKKRRPHRSLSYLWRKTGRKMRTYYRSTAHEPASRPTLESVRQVAAHRGLCLAGRFSPEKVTTSRPTRTSSPSLRGEGSPLWRVVDTIPVPIVVFLFTIEQVPKKNGGSA
jgi:hypothetical protein